MEMSEWLNAEMFFCGKSLHVQTIFWWQELRSGCLRIEAVAGACEASWGHALQLAQEMQLAGLQRDSITFGSLINACGKAVCWQLAVNILEESLEVSVLE